MWPAASLHDGGLPSGPRDGVLTAITFLFQREDRNQQRRLRHRKWVHQRNSDPFTKWVFTPLLVTNKTCLPNELRAVNTGWYCTDWQVTPWLDLFRNCHPASSAHHQGLRGWIRLWWLTAVNAALWCLLCVPLYSLVSHKGTEEITDYEYEYIYILFDLNFL